MDYKQLVEQVATALKVRNGCDKHEGCENRHDPDGCACRGDARAAISAILEAIKKPTPDQAEEWHFHFRTHLNTGGPNFGEDYLLREAYTIALSPLHKEDEK